MDPRVDQQSLTQLLDKIRQATDYQCLYALEEDFNKVGLTIQTTPKNRMIVCRLVEGRPVARKVIEDYLFIGSLDTMMEELPDRLAEKVCHFVQTKAGPAGQIQNLPPAWRDGLRMRDAAIVVMNEDAAHEAPVALLNEDVAEVADELLLD